MDYINVTQISVKTEFSLESDIWNDKTKGPSVIVFNILITARSRFVFSLELYTGT